MPSEELHIEQLTRNTSLLKQACFDCKTSKYNDWVITIAFYAALHSIDMVLDNLGYNDPSSHFVRNKLIDQISSLRRIAGSYRLLYSQSKRARYSCTKVYPHEAEHAVQLMKKIQRFCYGIRTT